MSYPCVLSAKYVAIAWVISVCYQRHVAVVFITLKFMGLFSIETRIATQFSMTSRIENEAMNAAAISLFTGHFLKFERCFCSKTDHFTGQFGCKYDRACIWDQIAYYFIKFRKVWMLESDSFNNEILAGETVLGAWSSPILHIGRSFNTK